MKYLYIALFLLLPLTLFSQKENDNWVFGNSKWRFDNSAPNGFTHTLNTNPYIRYISSVISDKNTGDLLFYSDGNHVYNKNNVIMNNGNNLFGTSTGVNSSDQSSIIVPKPNSSSQYYIFYISGNRTAKDQNLLPNTIHNYGLRYAIVDMALNGGLGSVISKNNVLFTNSPTNALTSTFTSDGTGYWILTANNGQFLAYRLDANGLNSTPVTSNAGINAFNFLKVSPNGKKVLLRNTGVFLYNFNNTTGTLSNPTNITPANQSTYYDSANTPNSAEFSPDSNIVYFINSKTCLCEYPYDYISSSGISMYNIAANSLVGVNQSSQYLFPLPSDNFSASMQLAKNGKIYLIYNLKHYIDPDGYTMVDFGSTINNNYYPYDWGIIESPNTWNPSLSPLSSIPAPVNTKNGFSFPQLIPLKKAADTCLPDLVLNSPETNSNYTYQVSNTIITEASYTVNSGQNITMKAGQSITLLPDTFIMYRSNYLAKIEDCKIASNYEESVFSRNNLKGNDIKDLYPDLKIYPNPSSNLVNIETGNVNLLKWQLFDMSGKMIIEGKEKVVHVDQLPKSVYILSIHLENAVKTKKIIVQ